MTNHTHEARIDFRIADVTTTLVEKVAAASVTPLCGEPWHESTASPRGGGRQIVLRFFAANDNEAKRTAKVAAAAILPLVAAARTPKVRALEVTR